MLCSSLVAHRAPHWWHTVVSLVFPQQTNPPTPGTYDAFSKEHSTLFPLMLEL